MTEVLPKVTVQYVRKDGKLGDLHVADAESRSAEDLKAAVDYIVACPDETKRGIPRVHKR